MEITIKGKVYDIPETINEIKLRNFKKVAMLDFANMSPMQYNLEIATILFEEDKDYFKDVQMEEFKEIMNIFESYKENRLTDELSDYITLGGPSVIQGMISGEASYKKIDLTKITVGEWIDLNDLMTKGALENLDKILSIIFRKEGEKYDFETLTARAPLFNELSIGKVYGAIAFFQNTNKN